MNVSSNTEILRGQVAALDSKVGDLERALGRLTAIVVDRLPADADGRYKLGGYKHRVSLEERPIRSSDSH
jgi:hypothetical protein